jgi:hypothetical protein
MRKKASAQGIAHRDADEALDARCAITNYHIDYIQWLEQGKLYSS